MKVLVTGANGFIGSALVQALVQRGDEVVCVLFPGTQATWLEGPQVRMISCDITKPNDALRDAIASSEQIYHLAGARIGLTAKHFFRVNAEGTRQLLQLCKDGATALQRFVLVSSATVSGPSVTGQAADETKSDPKTPYARSKREAERIALEEFAKDLPITVIRPTAIYGPRTTEWVDMLNLCAGWGRFAIFGWLRPEARMDMCHVDDLVRGMLDAAQHPDAVGETFILGGIDRSWSEMGQTVAGALGVKAKPLRFPIPILFFAAAATHLLSLVIRKPFEFNIWRAVDFSQPNWTFSYEKAKRILGYEPKMSFEEGAKQTVDWMCREGWVKLPKKMLPPKA
ncbi:MAG: NAD-dependent epimerase/dehydratase family protein [Myxococcales bacterium]|nr:NAD-dependent epimerase/dehydratase family protein [Myxococcales bacterium]